MTSDKAQIQALINDIDEALNKTSPRLPWVMSNDAAQQRQVLEQTRQYLTSLQQQTEAEHLSVASEAAAPKLSTALEPSPQSSSESAQQVLQAVLQEMNYWRVNMLQPLRTEIDSLQRQREMLTQEIRQLETQRHQHSLGAQPNQQLLMEFLQSAMAQMQANLSGQVTQMIASQMQLGGQPALPGSASVEERLAQMQRNQLQSDQLMLKLDSTLQVIFESLSRNVQTYEESLEQGLNRMHSLGQQGEAMFAFLVNRLAQQLGREASTFLQATAPTNWQSSSSSLPATDPQRETPTKTETAAAQTSDFLSQVPNPTQAMFVPAVPFDLSEEVLDISELELLDQPEQLDQAVEQPLDSSLAGLDLELSQLDLTAIPTPESTVPAFDLFAGDQPLPASPELSAAELENFTPTPISDLDSALDLLNQLSAEMQASLAMGEETPPAPPVRLNEPELITTPDSLYDDAFYSNLFQESATDLTASGVEASAEANPVDAMTLEQAWFDGLGDPAAEALSEPSPQPDFSRNLVSQSLENFLLSNPAPTPVDTNLLAEFAEQFVSQAPGEGGQGEGGQESPVEAPIESLETEPLAIESLETISSLTDLIPPNQDFNDAFSLNETASGSDLPAAGFQELPVTEAATEDFTVDLGNAADSLTQLGADLGRSVPSRISPELIESGWDVFTDSPNADLPNTPLPSKPVSEPVSNPPAVTIEGLEGLFEDLPNVEPSAGESASPVAGSPQIEATPDLFAQLKAAFSQDAGIPLEVEQPIVLQPIDPESFDDPDSAKKK